LRNRSQIVRDRYDRPVMLFESEYQLRMAQDKHPKISFHESSLGLRTTTL
jgi:peptide chain release factor 3